MVTTHISNSGHFDWKFHCIFLSYAMLHYCIASLQVAATDFDQISMSKNVAVPQTKSF